MYKKLWNFYLWLYRRYIFGSRIFSVTKILKLTLSLKDIYTNERWAMVLLKKWGVYSFTFHLGNSNISKERVRYVA